MGVLEDEYRARLARVSSLDQAATSWVWLWYAKERYAVDGLPEIYALCQKGPKDRGLANIVAYARMRLTDRELFQALMDETALAYALNLYSAGVFAADVRTDAAYLTLAKEVVLEGVKACRPLYGIRWDPEKDDCPVSNAAATTWLRYVDAIHELYARPRVRELTDTMTPISSRERELTELDDFSEFALSDRERSDLETDLDLTAEGGGSDARRS